MTSSHAAYIVLPLLFVSLLTCSDAGRSQCSESGGDKARIVQLLNKLFPLTVQQSGALSSFKYKANVRAQIDDSDVTLDCFTDEGSVLRVTVAKTITTELKGQLTGECRKRSLGSLANAFRTNEKEAAFTATQTISRIEFRFDRKRTPISPKITCAAAGIELQKDDKKAKDDDQKRCPLLEGELANDFGEQMRVSILPKSLLTEMVSLCSTKTADAVMKSLAESLRGAKIQFAKAGDSVSSGVEFGMTAEAVFSEKTALSLDNLVVSCDNDDAVVSIKYRAHNDATKDGIWEAQAKGSIKETKSTCIDDQQGTFVFHMAPRFRANVDQTKITVELQDKNGISTLDPSKGDLDPVCPKLPAGERNKSFGESLRKPFNSAFERFLEQSVAVAVGIFDCGKPTSASILTAINSLPIEVPGASGKLVLEPSDQKQLQIRCIKVNNAESVVQIKTLGNIRISVGSDFEMPFEIKRRNTKTGATEYTSMKLKAKGNLGTGFDCTVPLTGAKTTKAAGPGKCAVERDFGQTDFYQLNTETNEESHLYVFPEAQACIAERLVAGAQNALSTSLKPILHVASGSKFFGKCSK